MDKKLFSSVIQSLLHTEVLCVSESGEELQKFEERNCYNSYLQPLFTAKNLAALFADVEDHVLYDMRDRLEICTMFFRFDGNIFLVGPFVRTEFDAGKARSTLLHSRISGAVISSIRIYYSNFPLISASHVRDTLLACIYAFGGSTQSFSTCRLDDIDDRVKLPRIHYEAIDYSALYHRYDMENRFLRAIEAGDTENVLSVLRKMGLEGLANMTAIYQNPEISLAMMRALARKAAERGGAPLVEIHEITQRTVQKMAATHDLDTIRSLNISMIMQLTEAVRHHRSRVEKYSSPIKKTIDFISFNYSQRFTISQLAKSVSLSEAYLSRLFKKEVGMTIFQYTAHLRCQTAAELLTETEIPVSEISAYVGYIDTNYFAKVFKQQFGAAPTVFRTKKTS